MAYLRQLLSLEEMATSQLAINLCQDNSFKEVALCLEKPSICGFGLWSSPYSNNFKKAEEWDVAIGEQCQKLTKGLPQSLKHPVDIWIDRIALEYSSYSRRMELLFGVPRYYFMNNLTREDWTEACRINEMKLAKQLLKDDRLSIFQRYRIACVYCVHVNIPELWNELTDEEKHSITGNDDPDNSEEKNHFVLLWSYYMDGRQDEKVTGQKNHLWIYATLLAVHYGNRFILMQCWKRLNKHSQKRIVIRRALQSVEKWKSIQTKDKWRKTLVLNNYHKPYKQSEPIERFNLPSYYGELLHFFLSKMSERQQLKYFDIAYYNGRNDSQGVSVLRCLTEWPVQDCFLPTMKRLWGITPKYNTPNYMYGQILFSLAELNRGAYDICSSSGLFEKRESLYYDYGNVLWNLWEEIPEEYKQHLFCFNKHGCLRSCKKTVVEHLLHELVERDPLEDKDTALFKRVFHDIPEEKKIELIHSRTGKNIIHTLTYGGKLSFIDWLLQECLSNVEIPKFKKQFIKPFAFYCFMKLEENCDKYVEDFIDWAFESDTTKMQFKYDILKNQTNTLATYLSKEKFTELERMINFCVSSEEMKMQFKYEILKEEAYSIATYLSNGKIAEVERMINFCVSSEEMKKQFKYEILKEGTNSIKTYLREGKFAEAEHVINFCLSSEEMKTHFKVDVVKNICHSLLRKCAWEQMDKSLSWGFVTEEKIKDFKKDLFYSDGYDIHYSLVFTQRHWENVKHFYKWFCLSPEEIINIKKKTLFSQKVFEHVHEVLLRDKYAIIESLFWCLTDEEIVFTFKKEVEKQFFNGKNPKKRIKRENQQFDYLVNELLCDFRQKVFYDKTRNEGTCMKDKGQNRSLVMEDESNLSRKRFQHRVQE